jgi:hypothetical protein
MGTIMQPSPYQRGGRKWSICEPDADRNKIKDKRPMQVCCPLSREEESAAKFRGEIFSPQTVRVRRAQCSRPDKVSNACARKRPPNWRLAHQHAAALHKFAPGLQFGAKCCTLPGRFG